MINEKRILRASILIVDDKQANVLLLERMLRGVGYTNIASTNDPFAVCELHRKNHYDLILLDLMMPGMDGFQVMEGLKEIDPDGYLPVLVITAQPEHKLRALSAGAKDFVSKPVDLVELQTRIHNMLEVRLLYNKLEHYNQALELHNQVLEQSVSRRTAELTESEACFRAMVELSSDWYWEQDKNGHFTKLYGPVLEKLGIRIDDVAGNMRDEQGAGWDESEREILEANLAAKRAFKDFVYCRIQADGSLQYLMVSGTPKYDSYGGFSHYRGTGKDVTALMERNSHPRKAVKAKADMAN